MRNRVLRMIAHSNHYQTLCSLGLPIAAYALFDTEGQLVWSHHGDEAGLDRVNLAHGQIVPTQPAGAEGCVTRAEAGGIGQVFAMDIVDEMDGDIGRMLLLADDANTLSPTDIAKIESAMGAVADTMRQEFILNQELEVMATELAERYEELNLVFQSESSSHKHSFGFESLRRLVKDTTSYLGVGMAALILPAKNLEICDVDERGSVQDVHRLLEQARSDYVDIVRKSASALVVNNPHDREKIGLPSHIEHKIVLSPVRLGEDEMLGVLIAACTLDHPDFVNSDRNLLDVMANKAVKILQASFDRLTGLENAASFESAVGQALVGSQSRGLQHAILHVDIDRTDVINDISGREAGDSVIRRVAAILSQSVRSQDTVARISGDEFGILLENCSLESAAHLAEKLSRHVESENFDWDGTIHPLSICIGVAPISADSESVAAVISSANVARQAAQEHGRNRIQVYELNDVELVRRRGEFRWVERIQSALREDRFELFAQLIHDLGERDQPPHYEVLIRMRGEKGELITPNRFIPAAEHYHLMPDIDQWVVHSVANAMLALAEDISTPPIVLSVNLSGQSLGGDGVKRFVGEELDRLGALAGNLCFEITESAAITNIDDALAFIQFAKSYGVKFSLDDFGSGLSSFAYLKRFDVDHLKIDGSFVKHVDKDPVAETMVAAINQVGQAMGLLTIAEFVENGDIVDVLKEIGVDYAQGYHFAKPVPLADITRQIRYPLNSTAG